MKFLSAQNSFPKFFLNILLTLLSLSPALSDLKAQQPAKDLIEAKITRTFIPARGFDTNDDVHFVAEGFLPNHCYSLVKSIPRLKIENDAQGTKRRVFEYKQWAERDLAGPCSPQEFQKPENLYRHLPRHFTLIEVPLPQIKREREKGVLYTGEYFIRSYGENQRPQERSFWIRAPETDRVDDIEYATVSDVSLSLEQFKNEPLKIEVSVWLSNLCQVFESQDIHFERQGDVLLIRPLTRSTMKPGDLCPQVLRAGSATLTLEESLDAGRYLVHTRSRDGKGFNNIFSVTEEPK